MRIAEALDDSKVFDPAGRLAYALCKGCQYVLYDAEADAGVVGKALRLLGSLDDVLLRYQGQPLIDQHILVPFIGGQGDAVVLISCLLSLLKRCPDCRIDVSCPALHHELFSLAAIPGLRATRYPPLADEINRYNFYAGLEGLEQFPGDPHVSLAELFTKVLHTPPVQEAVHFSIPPEWMENQRLDPAEYPRIGIALAKSDLMKSYPPDLALRLAKELLERGAAVFFLGLGREIGQSFPHAPPMLCNLIDRIPGTVALATLVNQLDGIVCSDSFVMHLAGALRKPAWTVFTSTSPALAKEYPTVQAVFVQAGCNPCGSATARCPLHYPSCIVPRHADLQPSMLADRVMADVRGHRRNLAALRA